MMPFKMEIRHRELKKLVEQATEEPMESLLRALDKLSDENLFWLRMWVEGERIAAMKEADRRGEGADQDAP